MTVRNDTHTTEGGAGIILERKPGGRRGMKRDSHRLWGQKRAQETFDKNNAK